MSDSTACPLCGTDDWWSVLVTTQQGVRLPGDSKAADDEETLRELGVCSDCGACYDPVVADGPPASERQEEMDEKDDPAPVGVDLDSLREQVEEVERLRQQVGDVEELRRKVESVADDQQSEQVERLREEVRRLENAVTVLAGIQAGMAEATSDVDQESVLDALSNTDVLPERFE